MGDDMEPEFKLVKKNDIEIILPLLEELDPSIPKAVLQARLSEMVEIGYECIGIYCKGELIGICGLWTLVKYYIGKHIELDNVYIKTKYRGLGIGRKLNG
jgi:GNAT superfamily N-acetyltransferase